MYDCCVARERLRIVMSSIMRWRRGLVVAIGASCPERGGCDHHILSDGRFHRSDLPAAPKEQVRSMGRHRAVGAVDLGIVERGLVDPALQIVGNQQLRRAAEE